MLSPLEVVAVSPAVARPGLDTEVINGIQQIDTLVRDMREGIRLPTKSSTKTAPFNVISCM